MLVFLQTNFVNFDDIKSPIHSALDIQTIGEKYFGSQPSLQIVSLSINKLEALDGIFHDLNLKPSPDEQFYVKPTVKTDFSVDWLGNLTQNAEFAYTFNF